MGIVFGLIIAVFLGLIPANIARRKGRSFGLWWFYGAALFIVAIIHVLLIKDNNTVSSVSPVVSQKKAEESKPAAPVQQSDRTDELKKYKELLDAGVLSQEEYDIKKKGILGV